MDDNANCPAAFLYQGLVDEFEFGTSFISAFIKMITAGYDISEENGGSSSESSSTSDSRRKLKVINLPEN